jgi:hypothetical protein
MGFLDKIASRDLAEVQYDGLPGISLTCRESVARRIQFGETIESALILTSDSFHALLLCVRGQGDVIVKAGFASGYPGEGPRTLADVLILLEDVGALIDEVEIASELMERIERSSLTNADLAQIGSCQRVRPMRWHEYIYDVYGPRENRPDPWSHFSPVMPLGLIDPRLRDIAKTFNERPDEALLMGFRRLEDLLRRRVGSTEVGTKLVSQCLLGDAPMLRWKGSEPGEQVGRAQLFVAAFKAFRNPRAHRELDTPDRELWHEFLLLNHLFCLEGKLISSSGA